MLKYAKTVAFKLKTKQNLNIVKCIYIHVNKSVYTYQENTLKYYAKMLPRAYIWMMELWVIIILSLHLPVVSNFLDYQ